MFNKVFYILQKREVAVTTSFLSLVCSRSFRGLHNENIKMSFHLLEAMVKEQR